jgi:hypothetical protein
MGIGGRASMHSGGVRIPHVHLNQPMRASSGTIATLR